MKNVKAPKSLTIQYDKMLYLIEDSELIRAIGKYIDVYHYPDGRKELRLERYATSLTPPTTDCQKSTRARLSITSVLAEPWSLSVWCRASGITRALSQFPLEMALPDAHGQSRKGRNPSAHWIMMTCSKHSNSFSHVQRTFLVKSPLMVLLAGQWLLTS